MEIRYGPKEGTSDWDKLAVLGANTTEFLNEGINVGKTYAYRVTAHNAKGYGPTSAPVTAQTPTDIPLNPIDLRVVPPPTTNRVTLSWFDQADNETGFIIELQDVPVTGDFVEIARINTPNGGASGGVTWTDTTVSPGRSYNYQVRAYNDSGMSVPSNPVMATTPGVQAPATALTATVISLTRIDLNWADNATDETGFRVERKLGLGGTWGAIATLNPNTVSYSDTTVAANNVYYYRIISFNANGDGAPSAEAVAVTPSNPPAAPSTLKADGKSQTQILLTWTDNSNNEMWFYVERAISKDGPFVEIKVLGPNTREFVDEAVARNRTYYYRASASNQGGNSEYSKVVSAKTR